MRRQRANYLDLLLIITCARFVERNLISRERRNINLSHDKHLVSRFTRLRFLAIVSYVDGDARAIKVYADGNLVPFINSSLCCICYE